MHVRGPAGSERAAGDDPVDKKALRRRRCKAVGIGLKSF